MMDTDTRRSRSPQQRFSPDLAIDDLPPKRTKAASRFDEWFGPHQVAARKARRLC